MPPPPEWTRRGDENDDGRLGVRSEAVQGMALIRIDRRGESLTARLTKEALPVLADALMELYAGMTETGG